MAVPKGRELCNNILRKRYRGYHHGKSGGNPEYAPYLAAAASACGIRGFFAETHPEPAKALSDGANMVSLNDFPKLLENIKKHSI